MRVLMTADPNGGVWQYALELCAAFGAHDIQVVLATLGTSLSRPQRDEIARLRNVTLRESRYRLEWMPDPWRDLDAAADWLLELERTFAPDVVHLNHLVHCDLPWRAPVLVVGHSCVLSWWASVRRGPAPAEWTTYARRVGRSLRAAAHVVAPTRAMLAELAFLYGPFRSSETIPNARDPRRFVASRKEPLVLAAGRVWDDATNMAALAAVAPSLSWPVCIAGPTRGPAGNGDSPHFDGNGDCPHFLGALDADALAQWYGRAAIFALPARYEPFGLTALEAALSGCALVLGDIESLREVWDDAALYVPPEDRIALRDAVTTLIDDAALRRDLVRRAGLRARRYSPEDQAARYAAAYCALFAGEAASAGPVRVPADTAQTSAPDIA
jgi:glycosyltransferase involved in cell wall biosynthesis